MHAGQVKPKRYHQPIRCMLVKYDQKGIIRLLGACFSSKAKKISSAY